MGESWCNKSFQVYFAYNVTWCQNVAAQHSCHKTTNRSRKSFEGMTVVNILMVSSATKCWINSYTEDPVVFGLTDPLPPQSCLCCSDKRRGFVRGGWLICHRSSFQSLLCTAAHLDADVRRLASCAKPVPLECGAGTKGGCISFLFLNFISLFSVGPCSASLFC